MSAITETETSAARRLDKLGVIVAAIALAGLFLQPFALSRANRIVSAEGVMLWAAMPPWSLGRVLVELFNVKYHLMLPPATNL